MKLGQPQKLTTPNKLTFTVTPARKKDIPNTNENNITECNS